jgi:hypothetical protein
MKLITLEDTSFRELPKTQVEPCNHGDAETPSIHGEIKRVGMLEDRKQDWSPSLYLSRSCGEVGYSLKFTAPGYSWLPKKA